MEEREMDQREFIRRGLDKLRKDSGATMASVHTALKINHFTLKKLFQGDVNSTRDKALLRAIIEHFGSTEDRFFNRESPQVLSVKPAVQPALKLPLYGEIPAGAPIPVEGSAEPDE